MTERQFNEAASAADSKYRVAIEQAWQVYRDTSPLATTTEYGIAWNKYREALALARANHKAEFDLAQCARETAQVS